jgi:hypothetical protein
LAIGHSDPPPSLQALGEILFDNIDEDVISVVGNTPRASDATYSGLAIIERSELSTTHGNTWTIWQEIWIQNLAGQKNLVGRPTDPDFRTLDFFAKKGKNKENRITAGTHIILLGKRENKNFSATKFLLRHMMMTIICC